MIPSPMNPRKTFDEADLQELADNIERQGLLQPITVRPVKHPTNEFNDKPDKYEIVCGERRFRAVSKLSEKWAEMDAVAPKGQTYNRFSTIAAIVREMNDDEAFDAMITENLQRKDVDPIEEAFAFGQLHEKGKSLEEIANRFGKSLRFVQDRVKLNSLIPELMAAVKTDKMSISAAMIICKLDEEDQRKYYNSYLSGYTKANAESYTNSLFMSLSHAPWYNSGARSDNDFEGGCSCKCSECQFNTANHGCLFWDMKNSDAGKCTNREMFYNKHLAFVLAKLKKRKDELIKVGQPMEAGKILIIDVNEWCNPNTKELKPKLYTAIKDAGYEVAKSEEIFSGECYDVGDKLKEKKKLGKIYHCLRIFNYDTVGLKEEWRYLKGSSRTNSEEAESEAASPQFADAMALVQKKERAKEIAITEMAAEMRKMADNIGEAKRVGDITDAEQLAFDIIIFTLCGNKMHKRYGYNGYGAPTDRSFIDIVKQNQADRAKWMREFIRNTISGPEMNYNQLYQECASLVLQEWRPKQYNDTSRTIIHKLDKKLAKIKDKLNELGYDMSGKLLSK